LKKEEGTFVIAPVKHHPKRKKKKKESLQSGGYGKKQGNRAV
jgi:hypothetical protein